VGLAGEIGEAAYRLSNKWGLRGEVRSGVSELSCSRNARRLAAPRTGGDWPRKRAQRPSIKRLRKLVFLGLCAKKVACG